ncbi:MAG: peptide chain release factor 1 [bacterium]|nr:peptide chain release factor 1 [bacterium]
MLDKLKKFETFLPKIKELEQKMIETGRINDLELLHKYSKEHSKLKEKFEKYQTYKGILKAFKHAEDMLKDKEMKKLAEEELEELKPIKKTLENDLYLMLVPKHPYAENNTIIEIRAGTGGDEAALFCGELFRMYSRYAENKGWKIEIMDSNPTEIGGFKEVTFEVVGDEVYHYLRFESGTHRVQRVPATESGGRLHTSAVTVAVLPEAEDVDIDVKQEDLRIDTFCASGKGGQSVNTTKSAVRITHLPTGMVASCQDERSQLKNKNRAMKVLKSRLLEKEIEKQHEEMASERKLQVGSGDRSEKIRTYNFPQDRITDHRISYTRHNLPAFLQGDMDNVIEALLMTDFNESIKNI